MSKKSDKIIAVKIDVTKINKDYLFTGKKGVYADLVIFYTDEQNVSEFEGEKFYDNGMVVQQVPKKIYDQDKTVKGPILGNCKVLGQESGAKGEAQADSAKAETGKKLPDDLPF